MTSADEFREFGKAMIDYVADYLENIRERPVLPNVRPGYLQQLVPAEAPEDPETWQVKKTVSQSTTTVDKKISVTYIDTYIKYLS